MPLGDLTVVLGPNDSGKTLLLDGLSIHLDQSLEHASHSPSGALFFAELADVEVVPLLVEL
jgi:predicted ATP-dependent endonuclease of OLD family